jgi:hypothetical protein
MGGICSRPISGKRPIPETAEARHVRLGGPHHQYRIPYEFRWRAEAVAVIGLSQLV